MLDDKPQKPLSVWQLKPWWCQPWSIALTGCSLIGGSWLLLHRIWITTLLSVPILVWMIYFLLVYPQPILQAQNGLTGEDPASRDR